MGLTEHGRAEESCEAIAEAAAVVDRTVERGATLAQSGATEVAVAVAAVAVVGRCGSIMPSRS